MNRVKMVIDCRSQTVSFAHNYDDEEELMSRKFKAKHVR